MHRQPWYVLQRLPCWYKTIVKPTFSNEQYLATFRMGEETFHWLKQKIAHLIMKTDTRMKQAMSPDQQLAICLQYLSTRASYRAVSRICNCGVSTVADAVHSVTRAICEIFHDYCKFPTTQSGLKRIAAGFCKGGARLGGHGIPQCVGSADGTHVAFRNPVKADATHYNRKGYHLN
eukprot:1134141-Pelagomonas_calceolata.AAC.1